MENRVRELREKNNWTQEELGRRLSVSRQTVISIEKGVYKPSLDLAVRISFVFGKSIHDIFINKFCDYRLGNLTREFTDGNMSVEEYAAKSKEIEENWRN